MNDFVQIDSQGWQGWVNPSCKDVLTAAFTNGDAALPVEGGRGATFTVELPGGAAYLRRYIRGGFVRHFIRDRYFLDNRPLREFDLLREMQKEGLPVPEPLGVVWRTSLGWFQGAIATRALDAENLYHYLRNTGDGPDRALRAAGAAVRAVHDARIWHADLQIRNILVAQTGAWVIDFDNARRIPLWRERHARANLLRLRRSFEKAGLPRAYFAALCAGYGGARPPAWLSRICPLDACAVANMREPGRNDE